MSVVMILSGYPDGKPTPFDGQYLEDFDFEANGGTGEAKMTEQVSMAKRFHDGAEVMNYLRTSPACKPLREDGLPNRPLTATNWRIVRVL